MDVEWMRRETNGLRKIEADPTYAPIYGLASSARLGRAISNSRLLDVDLAVMIAVDWDEEAICLDYRGDIEVPSVTLSYWPDDQSNAHHRKIADNFNEFAVEIGLVGK